MGVGALTIALDQFALEFVRLAREEPPPSIRDDLFSTRQSIAIVNLGLLRRFQIGADLSIPDLVELAIITTPLEAQGYAEMIALRVLLGDEREVMNTDRGIPELVDPEDVQIVPGGGTSSRKPGLSQHPRSSRFRKRLTPKELFDVLSLIAEQRIETEIKSEAITFANQVEEDLFAQSRDSISEDEKRQYVMHRTSFELVGGRRGILQREITNYDDLFDAARREVLTALPLFDKHKLSQGQALGLNEEMKELTRRDDQALALAVLDTVTSRQEPPETKILMDDAPISHIMSAYDTLLEYEQFIDRMGLAPTSEAPHLQEVKVQLQESIRQNVELLSDLLQYPELFQDGIDHHTLRAMADATLRTASPLDALKQARSVDEQLWTDLSTYVYERAKKDLELLTAQDVLDDPILSPEWARLLHDRLDVLTDASWEERRQIVNRLEELSEYASRAPSVVTALLSETQSQLQSMIPQASSLEEVISTKSLSDTAQLTKEVSQDFQDWMDQRIDRVGSRDELVNVVETAKAEGLPFSSGHVYDKGTALEMPRAELSKLLGNMFDYLMNLMEFDNPSFERVESLIENAHFSLSEIELLVSRAIEQSCSGALGALAYHDTDKILKTVPSSAADLLQQGLGAGAGENLLKIWFEYSGRLPDWMRDPIKQVAKRVVIELGKKKASSLIGSSEAGALPNGTVRPYFLGDDPDTVDIDETLEHILSTGKPRDAITVDDFVVRRMVSGRRCVVFLVDISGSMRGRPLSAATLVASMLLAAFARDELGVALFESNSHVVCEIGEAVDIDVVMDTLLDLTARGGTQMSSALRWARDEFAKSRSQDKMLIMVTDANLADFAKSIPIMEEIADMGVTSLLAIPVSTYGIGNIQAIIESASAQMVPIKSWDNFPELVSEILSRR
ncbi:MAG: VWA domain-containing protein [Candidatus Thorarchaeota archaeon]|nr:VWA domain-containing protein [Candidatus Thorarchaeota archaeon]